MTHISEISSEALRDKILGGTQGLLRQMEPIVERYLNEGEGVNILTLTTVYTALGMLIENLTTVVLKTSEEANAVKGCAGGLLTVYTGAKSQRDAMLEKYPYLKDSTYRSIPVGEVDA